MDDGMQAEEILAFRDAMKGNDLILAYSGYITEKMVGAIGAALKHALATQNTDVGKARRVFSVFVEQVQNIFRYSAERRTVSDGNDADPEELRYGFVAIGAADDEFFISSGNLVLNEDVPRLQSLLDEVHGLSREELRSLYKERLRSEPPPSSRGAGLGIIEIARRASRPVSFAFKQIDDDHSLFCIKAFI